MDVDGNVFVPDLSNKRIQKFPSDGTFVTKWGTEGSAAGQFVGPHSVAVDGWGDVFVADTGNNRIQKFTNAGTFLLEWGSLGNADGQFNSVLGVPADRNGAIYTTDFNQRVQKFACPVGGAPGCRP